MGGVLSGRDDHDVALDYGDICEVDVDGRPVATTFVETSDDGDRWFRTLCDGDFVCGSDSFSEMYHGVREIRFKYKADDPTPDLGAGI